MKETGVVRRIDELGRIVIPKEIRKRLRVSSGDMLDIYTTDKTIVLKKYQSLDDFEENINYFLESISNATLDFIVASPTEVIGSTISKLKPKTELTTSFLNMFVKNHDLELPSSRNFEICHQFESNKNLIARQIYLHGYLKAHIIMLSNEAFMKSDKDIFNILEKYIKTYLKNEQV